jgi:hypothetical protein
MLRYYFDFRDRAGLAIDDEGLELGNLVAVQDEAAGALMDMARDTGRIVKGGQIEQMAVEVRDDLGPVMRVSFLWEIETKNCNPP